VLLKRLREHAGAILTSPDMAERRPALRAHNESNIPGLYIIGDLAGAPVIKMAMAQGYEVIEHIAAKSDARAEHANEYDLLIVGTGAAGLNAALAAKEKGLRALVLEKSKIANTIEDFPEGKWVYAEPDETPPKGKLWLDGARKEDLLARWHQIVNENKLDVRTDEGLKALDRLPAGGFRVASEKGEYRARRIILATGQRGNPRKLNVPGEVRETVYHRLYGPRHYMNEDILVVGGGNSAVEAALALSELNRVRLSYRGGEFGRIFKDNERKLNDAVAGKRIELLLNSQVKEFGENAAVLEIDRGGHQDSVTIPCDHAFVLIGAELPVTFLKSLGIRLENEWTGSPLRTAALSFSTLSGLWILGGHAQLAGGDFTFLPQWLGGMVDAASLVALFVFGSKQNRFAWLGVLFLACYTVYGAKVGDGLVHGALYPADDRFRASGAEALGN
jgi:thioredoxin reductase